MIMFDQGMQATERTRACSFAIHLGAACDRDNTDRCVLFRFLGHALEAARASTPHHIMNLLRTHDVNGATRTPMRSWNFSHASDSGACQQSRARKAPIVGELHVGSRRTAGRLQQDRSDKSTLPTIAGRTT